MRTCCPQTHSPSPGPLQLSFFCGTELLSWKPLFCRLPSQAALPGCWDNSWRRCCARQALESSRAMFQGRQDNNLPSWGPSPCQHSQHSQGLATPLTLARQEPDNGGVWGFHSCYPVNPHVSFYGLLLTALGILSSCCWTSL